MKINFTIILVVLVFAASSQNNSSDSLKHLLRTEIADTSRVMALSELAIAYYYSKPDTSFLLAQQGYAIARQIEFKKGEASCLANMGTVFLITGNHPKALGVSLQAMQLFESLNDKPGMIWVNLIIGIIYSEQDDYKMAISYTWKSKKLLESTNIPKRLVITLSNLGDCFEKINQLDSARIYTNQAYELASRINFPDMIGMTLNNLGNIYSKMQQGEIALGYYRQSFFKFKEINDFDGLCETTLGMAKLFKKAEQADSALHYARLSMVAANQGGFTKRTLNASTFLSTCFKGLNRIDSAYYYQEITIAAKDSLFSQEKVREVQNLSFTEKSRQQEIEEANKQAEKERKSNIQLLGIAAFISFFFGLLFVFSKRKVKPRIIKFLGLLGLLLLFEFISLFLSPYIAALTRHTPVLILIVFVLIASALVPVHHKLEYWVKEKLAQRSVKNIQPDIP
jgi:tetratricopeptide (TPR) repeat protein